MHKWKIFHRGIPFNFLPRHLKRDLKQKWRIFQSNIHFQCLLMHVKRDIMQKWIIFTGYHTLQISSKASKKGLDSKMKALSEGYTLHISSNAFNSTKFSIVGCFFKSDWFFFFSLFTIPRFIISAITKTLALYRRKDCKNEGILFRNTDLRILVFTVLDWGYLPQQFC